MGLLVIVAAALVLFLLFRQIDKHEDAEFSKKIDESVSLHTRPKPRVIKSLSLKEIKRTEPVKEKYQPLELKLTLASGEVVSKVFDLSIKAFKEPTAEWYYGYHPVDCAREINLYVRDHYNELNKVSIINELHLDSSTKVHQFVTVNSARGRKIYEESLDRILDNEVRNSLFNLQHRSHEITIKDVTYCYHAIASYEIIKHKEKTIKTFDVTYQFEIELEEQEKNNEITQNNSLDVNIS